MASLAENSNGNSSIQDLYNSVTDMSNINSLKKSFQDMKSARNNNSSNSNNNTNLISSPSTTKNTYNNKTNEIMSRVANDARNKLIKQNRNKNQILSKDISKAFKPFDVNRDGLVTRKEFHRGLQSVAPKTTLADTKELLDTVTRTYGDGDLVPYANVSNLIAQISNEQHNNKTKLEAERLKIQRRMSMESSMHADLAENRLLSRFSGSTSRLRHALKRADTDGDHRLDPTQFKRSLLQLNVDVNENQIDKLIAKYDVDNNGTIDYDKFVDSIEVAKNANGSNGGSRSRSPSSLAKEVVDKMFKNSSVEMMAKHFRDLNVEKCGTLDNDTIERGLRLQGANLSKKDMDALLDATKSPYKKNRVDYRKLVNLMQNADLPEEQFQNSSSKKQSATSQNHQLNGYNNSGDGSSNNNDADNYLPWWDRQNQDKQVAVANDGSDTIIDSSQTVKTLNGRQTRRRASLHLQKTDVLPTSIPMQSHIKYLKANNGEISKGGDGINLRNNNGMNSFGRERTKLERNEAIVTSRIANVIDDKMNRLKQVYDDSSGKSALTYKELQGGFRDCGINLGTEDFNRLVSAADKSNKGYVSFDNIVKVVEKAGLGVPKDVTYFANQHYTKTSNKAMAAGRPSNKNHNVVYNDDSLNNASTNNNTPSKGYYMSSTLFQHKDLYQNAAPTYVTSVMQQPSSEFLAKNRRKSVSPPGSALRPNTSVEFGRTTGNILLADSLAGKIPSAYPQGHLYGQSGHAVARDGRRQMKQPDLLSEKESGHRLKDLIYNHGATIGPQETDLHYGMSKRMNVSLHGKDAAGTRTVDSRALRRRVAPDTNVHGSEGVSESFNPSKSRSSRRRKEQGKQRRSGKKRIGQKNISQFHHNRATPVNYHTYNMYNKVSSSRRKNVTPRSNNNNSANNRTTKIIHFSTPPPSS